MLCGNYVLCILCMYTFIIMYNSERAYLLKLKFHSLLGRHLIMLQTGAMPAYKLMV